MSHICCFWNSLTIIFPNWISRLLLSLSMPFRASQLQVCFKFFANTAIKAKLPNLYWLTLVFRWEIEQIAHLKLLTTRTNIWGKLKISSSVKWVCLSNTQNGVQVKKKSYCIKKVRWAWRVFSAAHFSRQDGRSFQYPHIQPLKYWLFHWNGGKNASGPTSILFDGPADDHHDLVYLFECEPHSA